MTTPTRTRRRVIPAAAQADVTTPDTGAVAPRTGRVRRVGGLNATSQAAKPMRAAAPKHIQTQAAKAYALNALKNKATNEYNAERKTLLQELLALREKGQPTDFVFPVKVDNNPVTLVVGLEEGTKTSIDLKLLRSLVTDEEFMKIISATVASIKAVKGQTMVDRVTTTTKTGNFNAQVTTLK
ncbi:hypothetical protein H10PHJ05_76 [Aeromonas phage HJ05]|nr:hypothetical protein H10PHJ05_76 [Aeromonas phage HJ05]